MSKKIICLGIIFIAILFFISCSSKTDLDNALPEGMLACVDEEYISESRLQDRILYAKIFNESLLRTLKESNTEELLSKHKLSVNESDVKDMLIQDAAIRHYLGNKLITYNDISDSVDREIEMIKKEEVSYFNNIIDVIDEYNISFEKYQEISKDYAYDLYNRQYLKRLFGDEKYKEDSKKNFDEQFEDFLKRIMKKSRITVYN